MFEEAVEECRKASVLTPNYAGVFWTEATALYQLKRYGEAAQLFENLGKYFPRNPQVLANLGVCYIQMGRKAEAVEVWKKAHALNPGDSQVIQYLKANGVSL
jgi:Flp pilus assembly protein TadD